jgi:hypothetical protein
MDRFTLEAEDVEQARQRAIEYGRLKNKYRHAVSHPWESVEPEATSR